MDQDPTMAGGTDVENMTARDPGQDTQTLSNGSTIIANAGTTVPTADSAESVLVDNTSQSAPQPQVFRPVDSHHIERDLRLPGDKARNRTRIIIGAVIGGIVLILAGLAIWFFAYYNNPDKVMLDGINNVFRASNISLDGGGAMILRESDDSSDSVQSVILNLNSSSSKLPNATDVSVLVSFADEKSINLKLGTVQMTDGVIYLRVEGIIESLRSMGLDAEIEAEMEELFNTFETIDGEWWRISIRDVLQDMSGSEEIADLYGSIYDCALNAVTRDNSKTFVDLYKQHKFVDVEPVKRIVSGDSYEEAEAWHNLYEISLNKTELAAFLNAIPTTDMAEEMYTCYNNAITQYDSGAEQISAQDVQEISASDIDIPEDLRLYAEVSQFSHKIRSIRASADNDEWVNTFGVRLEYQDVQVTAPSEYRDISELFNELPIEDVWGRVTIDYGNVDCHGNNCVYTYDSDSDYDFDNNEWIFTGNEIEEV